MRKSLYAGHTDRWKQAKSQVWKRRLSYQAISNSVDLSDIHPHRGESSSVDGGTALRAALSWNHPDSVSTFETGRAATTRYL